MADQTEIVKTTDTTHTSVHVKEEPKTSLLSNVIAIVGFIILIVIVIWGLVHLATLSSGWFSSLFSNSAGIALSAPKEATSGVPIEVSWKYSPAVKGTYAFLYRCNDGFQFKTSGQNAQYQIPCGAAFTAGSNVSSIALLPLLTGSTSVQVPVSIIFMPSSTSSKQVQGNATITIHPAAVTLAQPAPQPTQTPTPTAAPVVKKAQPTYRGTADLSVRIISANADASGFATVVFDIANVGGSPSGSYYFTAQLPSSQPYPYTSPSQTSLSPGDHVVNTLRFSQAINGVFQVIVDPANLVPESNEINNIATQSMSAPYYNNYNYANPQPYQNQYQAYPVYPITY